MNPFEMVVAIVFLAVIGSVLSSLFRYLGERKQRDEAGGAEVEALRDQIVTLEERIRVLERIVTDAGSRDELRRQFRDLERDDAAYRPLRTP